MPRQQARAQLCLGTLCEITLPVEASAACFTAGFAALQRVQARLSRFDAASDVARFNALPAAASLALAPVSQGLLRASALLQRHSAGQFDISLGTGPQAWSLQQGRLFKHSASVQLDVGGIAKGLAVDLAVAALKRAGCAWGCVNAGGDLRCFGPHRVQLQLRDEQGGGVRAIGTLSEGSFATSYFGPGSRSALALQSGLAPAAGHISVAAPRCLWADALTKLVAASGDPQHPLLARFGAQALIHPHPAVHACDITAHA